MDSMVVEGWSVLSVPVAILSFLEHGFLSSWTNLFQALSHWPILFLAYQSGMSLTWFLAWRQGDE